MIGLIIAIAIGVAAAPYAFHAIGIAGRIAAALAGLLLLSLASERLGAWYDATPVGRWHNTTFGRR